MLPSLANLGCDTDLPVVRGREELGTEQNEENEPELAKKERRTPILVNGEWVCHYRYAPLDDQSIRRAVAAIRIHSVGAAWDVHQRVAATDTKKKYGPIAEWDTSEVVNLDGLFSLHVHFRADLSGWDVGNVRSMYYTFYNATSFTSDLSKWNVGNVERMGGMFCGATNFVSDLSKWDVGKVTGMERVFNGAKRFTSDLSKWDVGNVKDMTGMFDGATSFTSTRASAKASSNAATWCGS